MKKWDLKSALKSATSATDRLAGKAYKKADELVDKTRKKAVPATASALKSAFNGTAGATGYLSDKVMTKYHGLKDDIEYPTPPGVPLTKGEATLLKSIFGTELDTDLVKKYYADKEHPRMIARSDVNKIKFYDKKTHLRDYSQAKDRADYCTFIHEMTHVWQFQHPKEDLRNALRNPTRKYDYDYELSEKRSFQDFGVEQQACIIADYALQCLFNCAKKPTNDDDTYIPEDATEPNPQSLSLLYKTVEDRFPQARKTRLMLKPRKKPSSHNFKCEGF